MNITNSLQFKKVKYFLEKTINIWSVLLLVLAFYLWNDAFLNKFNAKNLLTNMAPLLVMATGATFMSLIGSVDLSMGAVCSVANVILVELLPVMGWKAYLVAAIFGIFAGLLLGIVQTKTKIPSFIASLGFMRMWESVALLITASPVSIASEIKGLIAWGKTSFGIISLMTIFALIIALIFFLFQRFNKVGRSFGVIGGNERAAWLSGIPVQKYKLVAFMISGFTAALCAGSCWQ